MNKFSIIENNLLVRLIVAQIICDFILYNHDKRNRVWKDHVGHSVISGTVFYLLSGGSWVTGVSMMLIHFAVEIIKGRSTPSSASAGHNQVKILLAEQIVLLIIICLFWRTADSLSTNMIDSFMAILFSSKLSLIALGYMTVIWPAGTLIGMVTKSMIRNIRNGEQIIAQSSEELEHAGRFIGICERIIIVTFVYFRQYEAIGFLITGKSILRLNSKGQTEYVLAGTMFSYAISIMTGVTINWLIK